MSEARSLATDLTAAYADTREQTRLLCQPLAIEDYGVQPMDDASPPKWHLAHTTWFFETFLLEPFADAYRPFHPRFAYLFNSYYNGVGTPFPRPERGNLSRPTVAEVLEYREWVDAAMQPLLAAGHEEIQRRVVLGLNHEQQHQELILTDLKYNLGRNPLRPGYREDPRFVPGTPTAMGFVPVPGGLTEVGLAEDDPRFKFDNETPRHKVWVDDFALGDRLVTNAEFLAFVEDGGYETPALWLSDGWNEVRNRGWQAPLYWRETPHGWFEYRLSGDGPLCPHLPVSHVSYYEADAFARWAGARLPTEQEWETAAARAAGDGNFVEGQAFHPRPATGSGIRQTFGDLWEWTSSAYAPYPGFQPLDGTLGEYNGKFMSNQFVLRGGSCATPEDHVRATYRNFFYAKDRWQFMGIRLAKHER